MCNEALTLYGEEGSYAQAFAKSYAVNKPIPFKALVGPAIDWSSITSISTATGQTATSLKVTDDANYINFSIQGSGLGTNVNLPIGGLATINAFDATQVMKQLNPTIVIPMHYRTKALGLLGYVFGTVDKFISVSGLKAKEYEKLELNKTNMKDYSGIVVLKYN
jgi:hypothetical protein